MKPSFSAGSLAVAAFLLAVAVGAAPPAHTQGLSRKAHAAKPPHTANKFVIKPHGSQRRAVKPPAIDDGMVIKPRHDISRLDSGAVKKPHSMYRPL